MSILAVFGIIAAGLSTIAFVPYIMDTARRRTDPNRASWLIWSVLATLAFFSQVSEGASHSLWFAGTQTAATLTIFALSLSTGVGPVLSNRDLPVLGAAAIGLGLWYVTDTAVYALAISIGISLLGGAVTVQKAYRAPGSETLSTWVLCGIASGAALVSVGQVDPVLMAYPAYLLLLNASISMAIVLGRGRRVGLA